MTRIFGALEAIHQLKAEKLRRFHLISIRDKDSEDSKVYKIIDSLADQCEAMHVVRMNDLQFSERVCPGQVMPSQDLVASALEFAKGADNVAVHCTAGISRSSAMAFLVECQKTGDPEEAVNILNMFVHFPNKSIVMIGEHLLKMDLMSTIIQFNHDAAEAMFDEDNE